ncbi:ABC-type dipeptide transport system, periplasmic component [Halobacteroides halobius DSM 5150]|uniref:ABC-type dipeptide transport system, periplasmic component n=1 Tax=Halobacteroides halobius (strain ATCC 35273 / DSM 5150 / MD-1) TaxID=748449 RepID=L0KAT0_HALHC|nr:ABC transporter substrate-binding protein [Halobacteroides halobius]AGB42392.1 ABC-type dipeptide transport system, periplasmic component [Halobacteroides halobius DSM 5150]
MFKKKSLVTVLALVLVFSLSMTAGAWWIFGDDEEQEKKKVKEKVVTKKAKKLGSRLAPSEIWVYKSLADYNQAPQLEELVEAGKLPSVDKRLPSNPRVVQRTMMANGIGEYGGVWRDTFAVPVEGWNWAAGQIQGYFGINQIVQTGLVDLGPMWMLEKPKVLPRVATDWKWSADGKTLTMNLIKGAKWSDGQPFTADDIIFTYRHFILDERVPSLASKGTWTYGGEVTKIEKVNDYTIKWHFGVSRPQQALFEMAEPRFAIAPKHVYKSLHPAFNEDITYQEFLNAKAPQDLPVATLGPYVPTKYKPGQMLVLTRNPYFWQVDEEGNQLPYLNEVWFTEANSGKTRTLNLINGSGDRTNIENPSAFATIKQAANQKDYIDINFGPFDSAYHLNFNLSLYKNNSTKRDKALRNLFRKLKFRKALSYATNRAGIANALFPSQKFVKPWYGAYTQGSAYYKKEDVTAYKYNVTKAKELLAELGFKDTDDNGIVNWPQNSLLAGQDLIIEALIDADQSATIDITQALVPMYRKVGIDFNPKPLKATLSNSKTNANDYEINVGREDYRFTPALHPDYIGLVTKSTPYWHSAGNGGKRDLLPFEAKMKKLLAQAKVTNDVEQKMSLYREIQKLYTKNLYTIPLIQVRRGIGINSRLKNIAPDTPVYQYDWTMSNFPLEIIWTPKEKQKEELYEDNIITPSDY